MRNEVLARAVRAAGVTYVAVARAAEVTPKTVSRWVASTSVVPRLDSRAVVAQLLGVPAAELWPAAVGSSGSRGEIAATFRSQDEMPPRLVLDLVAAAASRVDVVGCDEGQLWNVPGLVDQLAECASRGVAVRVVLADPDGQAVAVAAEVAGVDVDEARARARLAWLQVRVLASVSPAVELLMHDSVLGASVVRVDEHLVVRLVVPGTVSPVMYLQGDGLLAEAYAVACEVAAERALAYQPTERRAANRRRLIAAVQG